MGLRSASPISSAGSWPSASAIRFVGLDTPEAERIPDLPAELGAGALVSMLSPDRI